MEKQGRFWKPIISGLLMVLLIISLWLMLTQEQKNDDGISISSWVTYWSLDGVEEEIEQLAGNLDNLSLFAAYFNQHNQLLVDPKIQAFWEEQREQLNHQGIRSYLTIVNDRVNQDGTSYLKDTDLLYSLLGDGEQIDRHAEELVQLALDYELDGIEVDYEGMKAELELWQRYLQFIEGLDDKAKAAGLGVRVILEPNTPVAELNFPEGPEYVMMAYNLYGSHSGPGPKADKEFIQKVINKVNRLPGEGGIAFATGGFDWSSTGSAKGVTEGEALNLVQQYGNTAERDLVSGCLVYRYLDGKGIEHEMWYSDKHTLEGWIKLAKEAGITNCSIWRLGGKQV